MQSTGNNGVASQRNDTNKTAAKTHTLNCGRFGCSTAFVYAASTDWPTVSRAISDHSLVCKGGFSTLSNSPPRADTHGTQDAPSSPPLAPESLGVENGNCEDEVGAGSCRRGIKEGKRKRELEEDEPEYTEDVQSKSDKSRGCKRRRTEDERKQELEEDEYTEDVQPKSVKCRICKKVIQLHNRYMYYPGMWDRHRGTCSGIRKIERDKKTNQEKMGLASNPERRPTVASSFDMTDEDWEGELDEDEDEDEAVGFSTSNVRFFRD
ncbi:hypothetical protein CY34DRAFT_10542 [Suillus luteus UH-Slu-Lm8-n1]|uniref:Uncharacterized protein n=1 Tax=Suillus luteus UH-Slu-Lm8-n1 TaxID=930992 RepID=A0A0D0BQ69_9AGAM|nr:hypothetical protein CY34DRAFT_10542 [Suillus luteus UH-Slu-Lm8-n1]